MLSDSMTSANVTVCQSVCTVAALLLAMGRRVSRPNMHMAVKGSRAIGFIYPMQIYE